jgi:Tat protein translocase TatB subunit
VTLLFFDFGSGEILLILLVAFLIFGPDKIPELARNIGKFINDIKRASDDIKTEISREADRKDREKRLAEYEGKMAMQEATTKTSESTRIKEGETKAEKPDK